MKPILVIKDGIPCVKEGFTLTNEPIIIYNYWPIGIGSMYAEEFEGAELFKSRFQYQLRIAPYQYVDILLVDGGKTKSIFQEEVPIPKPKTRVKTRYKNGRWEKLLKARGWVIT